jgi:hypothetical protein
MKIQTVDGKTIDTEKLSDSHAELHEAVNNLFKICERYNKTMVCRVVLETGKDSLGANYTANLPEDQRGENVLHLLGMIGEYLESSTGGAVTIAYNDPQE